MKKYTLTKTNQQLINIFIEVGMPRSIAKILLYLSKVDQCIAQDIEHDTNLRQPEVSNATLQLNNLGMLKRTKK